MTTAKCPKTVCVFGDIMLDTYVHCIPTKVSSESPVLVCRYERRSCCPGGAGNVAANLKVGFGYNVKLVGMIGEDYNGDLLTSLFKYQGIEDFTIKSRDWTTIEKRRFVDQSGRQMLRVDTEGLPTVQPNYALLDMAQDDNIDTLVISDYGKGTCTPESIVFAIKVFRDRGKYVIVNGKPDNLPHYYWANLLVFNLAEAEAAWEQFGPGSGNYEQWNGRDIASLAGMLYKFINGGVTIRENKTDVLITCGDLGMELWNSEGPWRQSAIPVKVADVAGAGDTVVATIAAHGECNRGILKIAATLAAEVVSQHGTSICAGKGWV